MSDPMSVPSAQEITTWISAVIGAIGAALLIWKKQSSTKLEVRENESKGDWLARIERERDEALVGEKNALDRERTAQRTISSLELKVAMLSERTDRQARKLDLVMQLLIRERPDYEPLLTSAFGDLPGDHEDDFPTPGERP